MSQNFVAPLIQQNDRGRENIQHFRVKRSNGQNGDVFLFPCSMLLPLDCESSKLAE